MASQRLAKLVFARLRHPHRTYSLQSSYLASLLTSFQVINSMQAWKAQSYLVDVMLEQEISIPQNFPGFVSSPFFDDFQQNASASLHQIHDSIENLQSYLFLRDEEAPWVEQLKDYITQLQGVRPAGTPEEQFNHLYSCLLYTSPSPRD